MAANLEQLSLQKDDRGEQPEEDVPSVVIPNHLQLHTPDCLNLSFGSFGSGTNAAISGSGSFAPRSMKSNLEETSASVDAPAIDTRYHMIIFYILLLYMLVYYFFLTEFVCAEILSSMGMSILERLQMEI